ncbi:hypothetical protein FOA43_000989 [Brettanomyces nanus]|uniref:Zinc finger PHD-type domain-containing protein n=1 Tax=Eeniella nana TaxID=13502 RepID=A0A875RXB3_EENNA|nr:uncharacterized protein FOA43_000989 [Brettanomyces nanus]QPG73676.1 hypothetical protein FOA43_000989 [Brettanomyces nanus]
MRRQSRRFHYTEDAPYEEAETAATNNEEAGNNELIEEVTRCVCGSDDLIIPDDSGSDFDDVDTGFFIQCELCSVWQHGYCVGIKTENTAPEKYWCEQCRPDMHYLFMDRYGIQRSQYNPDAEHNEHSSDNINHSSKNSRRSTRRKRSEEKVNIPANPEPGIEEEKDDTNDEGDSDDKDGKHKRSRKTLHSVRDYNYEAMLRKALEESARESGVQPEEINVSSTEVPPFRNTRASSKRRARSGSNTSDEGDENGTDSHPLRHSRSGSSSDRVLDSNSGNESSSSTFKNARSTRSSKRRKVAITAPAAIAVVSSTVKTAAAAAATVSALTADSGSDSNASKGLSRSETRTRTKRSKRTKQPKENNFEEDKPFRVNVPSSRISMNEMKRRVFSIMEFISNIQLELSSEEDTKNSLLGMQDDKSGFRTPENTELQKILISCYNESVVRLDSLTKRLNEWENKYR